MPPREGSRIQCTDGRRVSPIRGSGALTRSPCAASRDFGSGERLGYPRRRRIRLVAYGARLESVLGATPRGFESRILRAPDQRTCWLGHAQPAPTQAPCLSFGFSSGQMARVLSGVLVAHVRRRRQIRTSVAVPTRHDRSQVASRSARRTTPRTIMDAPEIRETTSAAVVRGRRSSRAAAPTAR
jgi:hypothetical protein